MPSPFPGMDPFIELFTWQDFHTRMITAIADALEEHLAQRYVIRVERRVYVEHSLDDGSYRVPDIALVDDQPSISSIPSQSAGATATVVPVMCKLPMPEEHRESYLVIKDEEAKEVVTVLEMLSPNNKRRGSVGRKEYLTKRDSILQTRANLVEFDLLRGGLRLPMGSQVPRGDYYAIVSRGDERPSAHVYCWNLEQRIPEIAIPACREDTDVVLDLQSVVDLVYRRARYRSLDYTAKISPPLIGEQKQWVDQILEKHHRGAPETS